VIISDLSEAEVAQRLGGDGLAIGCGPFVVRIGSEISAIAHGLTLLYADYPVLDDLEFADIRLRLIRQRHFAGPQVTFDFDGDQPFAPLPLAHAWPCFEWALNWSIASNANYYLVLHAAVLERAGRALLMPGPPGSGKSTLCAALTAYGWRLLSDELALVDLETREIAPIPRPISLKNQSIQVIKNYVPDAVFGRTAHYTAKGSVAHLKPRTDDVHRAAEPAKPGWIIFPKYVAGSDTRFTHHSRADAVLDLGDNSFNYHILGLLGFEAVTDMVENSACYDLEYGSLDDAVATLDRMVAGAQS
jgi:HprK-related kinase A